MLPASTDSAAQRGGQQPLSDVGEPPMLEVRQLDTTLLVEIRNVRRVTDQMVESMCDAIRRDRGIHTPIRAVKLSELGFDARPLFAHPIPDADYGTRWGIVGGHRRLRAAHRLGLPRVPTTVVPGHTIHCRAALLLAQAGDNSDREDMSPLDEAAYYAELQACGLTLEQIGELDPRGHSETTIARRLELRSLPGEIQAMLEQRKLRQQTAQALCALSEVAEPVAVELARRVADGRIPEREARDYQAGAIRAIARDPGRPAAVFVMAFNDREGEVHDPAEVLDACERAVDANPERYGEQELRTVRLQLAEGRRQLAQLPDRGRAAIIVSEADRMLAENAGGYLRAESGPRASDGFITDPVFGCDWCARKTTEFTASKGVEVTNEKLAEVGKETTERELEQAHRERERREAKAAHLRAANTIFGENLTRMLADPADPAHEAGALLVTLHALDEGDGGKRRHASVLGLALGICLRELRVTEEITRRGQTYSAERLPTAAEAAELIERWLSDAEDPEALLRRLGVAYLAASFCSSAGHPQRQAELERFLPLAPPVGEGFTGRSVERIWRHAQQKLPRELVEAAEGQFAPRSRSRVARRRRTR